MTLSPIILASAYGSILPVSHEVHDGHHGYPAPLSPDRLAGAFEFSDVQGRRVTAAEFEGRWTLLFFGYSRCRSSCPVTIPKIVEAARSLRLRGIEARAIFVDLESPPLGLTRRSAGPTSPVPASHTHSDMNRIAAMRALTNGYGGDLLIVSGTRGQLAKATRAFMVAREHTPPREGEEGHSINHSSRIYLIAPDTSVAGYTYHDADPATLVATIARLNGVADAS